MSRHDEQSMHLPGAVEECLSGSDLAAGVGFTLQLLTTDEAGWPHCALLSVGEVVAVRDRLRLALWPTSRTTANLTRDGRGVLGFADGGAWYTARLQTTRRADISAPSPLAVFDAAVIGMVKDEVPYATLRDGITFELTDPEPVLERWRATVDALRAGTD
jgi:hypothetical protein